MASERVKGVKADLLWTGQKPPSIRDLKLKPKASQAYNLLLESVIEVGANCGGRFEEFAGADGDLPGDFQAKVMCAGCPSYGACRRFLLEGHPAFGVWAGEVRRSIVEED